MHLELWISFRYLFMRRKGALISLISLISILGVAVGVMALMVVLGVMAGFDNELRDKIVGTNSHLLIERKAGINDYSQIMEKLDSHPLILASSPYINGQVFLSHAGRIISLLLRGIEPERETKVAKIGEYLTEGHLDLQKEDIVIGRELANYSFLSLGQELTIISPLSPQPVSFKVAGIFESGMYDYDMNLVFVNLKAAQKIFRLQDSVTGIGVKLKDLYLAPKVKREVQKELDPYYSVRTWMEANRSLFSALKLEKTTMFIILTLIVLVASFNIASTLIVMVTEKTKDIGILKSIGATNRSLRGIFTFQGLIIGLVGTILGITGGLGLCYLLKRYQFIRLPQDIYYIQRLPVSLLWQDVLIIALAAIGISLLATFYPARQAAKLKPVEALRYE